MMSCILLSAGESARFGSPKALALINNQTAIARLQQTLLDGDAGEIIVVLGARMNAIQPHVFNHTRVRIVHNKDYKLGQTSSFQAGASSISANARGIMLIPVDCPSVAAASIRRISQYFLEKDPAILIPTHQHRRGHPPVFNASLKKEILHLNPADGINTLFSRHPVTEIALEDPGILKTFNTHEELDEIK